MLSRVSVVTHPLPSSSSFQTPLWVAITSSGCRSTAATTRPEDQRNPSRRLVSSYRFTRHMITMSAVPRACKACSAALCYRQSTCLTFCLTQKKRKTAPLKKTTPASEPEPCCVGFAPGKLLAVVLNIMSQSCGQACSVLANKTHLLKHCFPEWRNHSPPTAPDMLLLRAFF